MLTLLLGFVVLWYHELILQKIAITVPPVEVTVEVQIGPDCESLADGFLGRIAA